MNDEFNTTKTMKEKYGVSQTVSKNIAGRAVKYITNFGEKVDGAWRFNFHETAFIMFNVTFAKKIGEDEAFKRGMKIYFNIDCNRSDNRL